MLCKICIYIYSVKEALAKSSVQIQNVVLIKVSETTTLYIYMNDNVI